MKMLCLGPEGTNGHEAALIAIKRIFGTGAAADKVRIEFCDRNVDVLEGVIKGFCYGVVPVENSTEGLVGEVVKGFWVKEMPRRRPISVVGEIHLPIEHNLLVHPEIKKVSHVMEVMSHPQALAQCAHTLERLKLTRHTPTNSTAGAAQRISKNGNLLTSAAIASSFAAKIYGLEILRPNIEDVKGNTTRFHIMYPDPDHTYRAKSETKYRTAMLLETANEPGALLNALWSIAAGGTNLSSIHSIPLGFPGKYAFYCEFDESVDSIMGTRIIERLKTVTESWLVLGSYPQSVPEKGGAA